MGTGRSDYPNQINNVSAFPYIFRGALDINASCINENMKHAATNAIAALVHKPIDEEAGFDGKDLTFSKGYIIPKPFDLRLLVEVSAAVAEEAMSSKVAQKEIDIEEYKQQLRSLIHLRG